MTMKITLYKRNLTDVFQINAITVKKDYFMLTHKPFKTIKMVSKNLFLDGEGYLHENDLYQKIMESRNDHQFHVVKGDNGSGKSHLIRWIKEHYEQDAQNEAVIFISRMQSTLKGALQQIIDAEVIQNHETSQRLKKLIDANEHLDNKHLKNIILAHLMVAVEEDDDSNAIKLRKSKRNNLYDFLASQETREFLLRNSGPIDRIQKKLSPGANNEIMDDVDPHFVPEDFKLTSSQAQKFSKMDLSKKAISFLGQIQESTIPDEQEEVEEYRELLAKYLNQFLDKVVQECLSLRGTDLKDIFKLLRQELKKEGKNLTLLIEDITSFTGVDKDLVDVLIADHKEDETNSLCRLLSIVGITNGYYDTSLPGNVKDRITSHIEIDNVVIQSEDEAAELAARYINAVYLEDEQIQEWRANNYRLDDFPVASVFKDHTWALHQLEDGKVLSIFPFTKTALWNFYQQLGHKTPRNFLQTVLLQYIQKYTVDGVNGNFPPTITKVGNDFKFVPGWVDPNTDRVLSRAVPENGLKERYETLFRIWGNGTMVEETIDGKKYVGGLEEDVFKTFGLKVVKGNTSKTSVTPTSPTSGGSTNIAVPSKNPDSRVVTPPTTSGGIKTPPIDKPAIDVPHIVQPPIEPIEPVVETNPELKEAFSEIEKWSKGDPLSNKWIAELLEIIREYIQWDLEGIPAQIVNDYFTHSYVLIEGQTKSVRTKEEHSLMFKRTNELRYALEALASYKFDGKNSWEFHESFMALLSMHTWLEKVKDDILAFLSKPYDYQGDNWKMKEYVVLAEFYITSLLNGFTGQEQTPDEIYLQLIKDKENANNNAHVKDWKNITRYLNPQHSDLFRRYFNFVQGSVKNANNQKITFYYDAYEIISTIKNLYDNDFNLNLCDFPNGTTKNISWYTSINILKELNQKDRLSNAISSEVNVTNEIVSNVKALIGDDISTNTISEIVNEMKGLLNYFRGIQEPFRNTFEDLENGTFDIKAIVKNIHILQSLETTTSLTKQFIVMSNNPGIQLQPFFQVLNNFNDFVTEKNSSSTSSIKDVKAELEGLGDISLDEVKQDLDLLKTKLIELDDRGVGHVVK
jgi:hypothetical protein